SIPSSGKLGPSTTGSPSASAYRAAASPATPVAPAARASDPTRSGRPTPGPATLVPSRYRAQYTSLRRASVVTSVWPVVAAPMPSNEHTPYAGMPSAWLIAAAVTSPTRNPVNGPGPVPATTAASSPGPTLASSRTSLIAGPNSSP